MSDRNQSRDQQDRDKKEQEKTQVEPASPPAQEQDQKFRVMEAKSVTLNGQQINLAQGAIITSSSYGGEEGINSMKQAGLKLEPVRE